MDSRHQIPDIRPDNTEIRDTRYEIRNGSAIVLAIVLTTLLAILGVLFLLSSRVDSVTTSAVGNNQDLKLAVDTVVTQISEVLTHNVPGVDPNNTYYDYPDGIHPWLACLEPYQYQSGSNYFWRQVSNIYGYAVQTQIVQAQILPDYNNTFFPYTEADADGDGVSDSVWVPIQVNGQGITSSKGKTIYAAVRIIDNGGMLNINTGDKFDPSGPIGSTDGSSQTQINLLAMAGRDNTHTAMGEKETRLLSYRCGTANANFYEPNVIWQYGLPLGSYTPFDISDELNLRFRYILNRSYVTRTTSRSETLWTHAFDGPPYAPRNTQSHSITTPGDWFWIVSNNYPAPCLDPCIYDYRHLATTYNCDRIIKPAGSKMFNINSPLNFNKDSIYNAVREALDPCVFSSAEVAQITANLMDYIDGPDYQTSDPRYDPNNEVTEVNDSLGTPHYGFERPCVYISEIAQNFYKPGPGDLYYDANNPGTVYRSYAIELYKPYTSDPVPDSNRWQIVISGNPYNPIPVPWPGNSPFFVIANRDMNAPLEVNLEVNNIDANDVNDFRVAFGAGDHIFLQRTIGTNSASPFFNVDRVDVPGDDPGTGWLVDSNTNSSHSIQRDITLNKCIRKLWSGVISPPELGSFSGRYVSSDANMIQAHPANKTFTNIGEIGQLLSCDPIEIVPNITEAEVRLNLAESSLQNLFNYLTVIDPYDHNPIDPNETRIKGRININTAPWFVLAQLPWVTNPDNSIQYADKVRLAQAIVAYRDKTSTPSGIDFSARPGLPGFQSIGQLENVISADPCSSIGYYEGRGSAIPTTLLTPTDGVGDAFEERDVIFDRISNLVTVRSDVFTAYILVRIGTDGPQKRVIAIFDRSGVTSAGGKVKVIAVQQVPDPR